MKIFVLHGENELLVRDRLLLFIKEANKRDWFVEKIKEGESVSEKLMLNSLYCANSLLILEDYRLINKKDFVFLNRNFKQIDKIFVICSFGKIIPQTVLKKLPSSANIEKFDYPKIIYDFWNSIWPGNSRRILNLLREVLKTNPPELVFYSFFKRIRDLYWIKISPSTIPYSSKQVYWLEKQATRFTQKRLKEILNFLADIDVEAKMSTLGMNFYLDLVVFKYLK